MNIEERYSVYKDILNQMDTRKQSYIHSKSFTNFFNNYDLLKNSSDKSIVSQLLEEYMFFVDESSEGINRVIGMDIVSKYLMPIGKIYKEQLGFKEIIKQKVALFFSIIIDAVLILFGFEKFFKIPVPLITITTTLYYIVFLKPIIKKGKVFGIFW